MKNIITIGAALLLLLSVSCNKKEASTPVKTTTNVDEPRADAIKDAQRFPITQIALMEPSFDFGEVKEGDVKDHTFEIVNTGSNPLIISQVKPSCGCTLSEFTQDPIPPKATGTVTLKFRSEGLTGLQQKFAEVYTNTQKTPVIISFTANVTNNQSQTIKNN